MIFWKVFWRVSKGSRVYLFIYLFSLGATTLKIVVWENYVKSNNDFFELRGTFLNCRTNKFGRTVTSHCHNKGDINLSGDAETYSASHQFSHYHLIFTQTLQQQYQRNLDWATMETPFPSARRLNHLLNYSLCSDFLNSQKHDQRN